MPDLPNEERIILTLYSRLVNATILIKCALESLPPIGVLKDFSDRLNYLLSNGGNPSQAQAPQIQEYDPVSAQVLSYYERQLKPARKPKPKVK